MVGIQCIIIHWNIPLKNLSSNFAPQIPLRKDEDYFLDRLKSQIFKCQVATSIDPHPAFQSKDLVSIRDGEPEHKVEEALDFSSNADYSNPEMGERLVGESLMNSWEVALPYLKELSKHTKLCTKPGKAPDSICCLIGRGGGRI
jgi:hypothetical protein